MKKLLAAGPLLALGLAFAAPPPAEFVDRMRGNIPIPEEGTPPPLVNAENTDVRRTRNYAQQPPVIPHKIEGYQVDRHANRCLMCHGRTRTQESQAPMVSITHYMDRSGNPLAEISPRRYFCTQCHVSQVAMNPLVENRFTDVEAMLRRGSRAPARK